MPRLASLRERGASESMKSTVPAFTPCAWTSALTGVNPGRHGVYGFYDGNFQASAQELLHPGKFQAPTLWEVANNQSATVGVYNVPLTYPPRPIDGWMVSGMLTPVKDEVPQGSLHRVRSRRRSLRHVAVMSQISRRTGRKIGATTHSRSVHFVRSITVNVRSSAYSRSIRRTLCSLFWRLRTAFSTFTIVIERAMLFINRRRAPKFVRQLLRLSRRSMRSLGCWKTTLMAVA